MGNVYATADWHGCKVARKVWDFLQHDDKLYFLGDAADRGPIGAELIENLLLDERVTYLKGNHEEFFARLMPNIYKTNYVGGENGLWYYRNGGEPTVDAFIDKKKYTKEQIDFLAETLKNLPTECRYINKDGKEIILEHAGYTPWGMPIRDHDPLWDRDHFNDHYDGESNLYIVHGHTPIQYLKFDYGYNGQPAKDLNEMALKRAFNNNELFNWKPTILTYCDGHKIDIDMCTITSNRVALLDLDTFEEIYFDGE